MPPGTIRNLITGYESGRSLPDLSRECGYHCTSIGRMLKANGVVLRPRGRPAGRCREDAFDAVTEESAYWTGFLMADGCVGDPPGQSKRIQLAIHEKDIGHLEAFRDFLGSDNKIILTVPRPKKRGGTTRNAMFTVTSDRLAEALIRRGVRPRKSLVARVIGFEHNRDFWRGVIDGDGHVKDESSHGLPILTLTGSWTLVGQFRDFVRAICPRCGANPRNGNGSGGRIAGIHLTGFYAYAIVDTLYSGCRIALPRKLEMARRIISEPRSEDLKQYKRLEYRKITMDSLQEAKSRLRTWDAVAREFGISPSILSGIKRRLILQELARNGYSLPPIYASTN